MADEMVKLIYETLARSGRDVRPGGEGVLVVGRGADRVVITVVRKTPPSSISHERILSIVADECDVSVRKLLEPDRSPVPTMRRSVAIYLIKNHTKLSWPKLGAAVWRDHSTAMTAYRRVERELLLAPNDTSRLLAAAEIRIAQAKAMTESLRAAATAPVES